MEKWPHTPITGPRVLTCPQCLGESTLPDRSFTHFTCPFCGLEKLVVHCPEIVQVVRLNGAPFVTRLNLN